MVQLLSPGVLEDEEIELILEDAMESLIMISTSTQRRLLKI